jgi:hypothetical protein
VNGVNLIAIQTLDLVPSAFYLFFAAIEYPGLILKRKDSTSTEPSFYTSFDFSRLLSSGTAS